jgi:hypothetical protein
MKKVLLAGIAVLFLATGTASAVEQNWEMAIVLKEPGKEPMFYRHMMLTREDCSQILSDARRQMAESRLPTVTITRHTNNPPVTGEALATYCYAPDGTWTGAESPRFGFIMNADGTTSFYDKAERNLATGAAAEVDNAQLTLRLAQLLFQRNEVLACGDWRVSGSSDGELQGDMPNGVFQFEVKEDDFWVGGKRCKIVPAKCAPSVSC